MPGCTRSTRRVRERRPLPSAAIGSSSSAPMSRSWRQRARAPRSSTPAAGRWCLACTTRTDTCSDSARACSRWTCAARTARRRWSTRCGHARKRFRSGTWVVGRGWDQNDWADTAWPTAAQLDAAVPNHPVYLSRVDGHAAWVNSAALRAAQVTSAVRDPAGGRVLRGADGAPSGDPGGHGRGSSWPGTCLAPTRRRGERNCGWPTTWPRRWG